MIKKVSPDLSRTQAIEFLSQNDQELCALIQQIRTYEIEIESFLKALDLKSIITKLSLDDPAKWMEVEIFSGYSIWKHPVEFFKDNEHNLLLRENKILTYEREARAYKSLFDKVLTIYNGVTYDMTTISDILPPSFCFLQFPFDEAYVGSSSPFNSLTFSIEREARRLSLCFEYWDGMRWQIWDGRCEYSGWVDETNNLSLNGDIRFKMPPNWQMRMIDGVTLYWGKFYNTDIMVSPPIIYGVIPSDSVIAKLTLTPMDLFEENYKWCYFRENIYVTFPNAGDPYFEGTLFIRGVSTVEQKKRYFGTLKLYHEKDVLINKLEVKKVLVLDGHPQVAPQGALIYNLKTEQLEFFDGTKWRIIG